MWATPIQVVIRVALAGTLEMRNVSKRGNKELNALKRMATKIQCTNIKQNDDYFIYFKKHL